MTLSDEFHVHLTYFGSFVTFFGKKDGSVLSGRNGLKPKERQGYFDYKERSHIFDNSDRKRRGCSAQVSEFDSRDMAIPSFSRRYLNDRELNPRRAAARCLDPWAKSSALMR